ANSRRCKKQHERTEQRTSTHPRYPFPYRSEILVTLRSLPVAELNRLGSGHCDAKELRLDAFAKRESIGAIEFPVGVRLAVDCDHDLVGTGRDVAGVYALHASALQRIEFLEAVDVVRRELAVDVDPHGVESKLL